MNYPSLSHISIAVVCYGLLVLFILIDGLRHATSLKSLLLTLPHIVASLALVRSTLDASRTKHTLHACLFLTGLFTYSAMA